ncbi:MAG: glutaredoxin 3 [Pseudohongiellaceae bacterium]|jgi:glutaredoxin 3
MNTVTIYTTQSCPYCVRAKQLLERKGAKYDELKVDSNPQLRQVMTTKSNSRTVPQIWIGDTHIGGCDELFALERTKQLDELLNR